jgi:CRP-like cAMP-binding protein
MLKSPVNEDMLTTISGSGATRVRRTIWASCGKLANCCRDCRRTLRLICLPARRKLAENQVLFLAGDPGDSCYRVEDGLLKVTMVSRSGIERILSLISLGRDCR